jgi:hypothetical protein
MTLFKTFTGTWSNKMKITKQRLKEIIKEELNETANPEWESADKILRALVYLAQDLEDSSNAEPAVLASAIVRQLREAVDAMERRLNEKFATTPGLEEVRAPFPTGSRVKHEEYGEGVVTHAGTKNTNVAVKFDKETANGKKNRQVSRGSLKRAE